MCNNLQVSQIAVGVIKILELILDEICRYVTTIVHDSVYMFGYRAKASFVLTDILIQ